MLDYSIFNISILECVNCKDIFFLPPFSVSLWKLAINDQSGRKIKKSGKFALNGLLNK